MSLKENLEKSSENYIEVSFLWDKHKNEEFQTSEEKVSSEMAKIKSVIAKRKTLQDKIAYHVKGFG